MEKEKKQSNAEMFSRRSGTLISTEFVNVGTLASKVRVIIVKYKDIISGNEEKAIRFEYDYDDGYSDYTDTKIGVIDKDELEGLIKSLDLIWDKIYSTNPLNYTEVNFRSRSGFKAGCYYSNDWSFYVQISEHDGNSNVFLKKEDAHSLLEILTKGREKLLPAQ